MSENTITQPQPSRRSIVRGVAWSVPVVSVAATAPVFAASADPITGFVEALKCPGNSTPGVRDAVVIAFTTRSLDDARTLDRLDNDAWTITANGRTYDVKRTTLIGTTLYVVTVPRGNSANAEGILRVEYTITPKIGKPTTYEAEFAYSGTAPDHNICGRV